MTRVVVIGGGTGTSIVLRALRRLGIEPTAIVPTSDSGGSSGRLRKELGIIPVGDIRQCVLALGNFSAEECALWNTRFTKGSLDGHAIGNLILAGLLQNAASVDEALEHARKIWNFNGSIIPMTSRPTTLCASYRDGTHLWDEHSIDEPKKLYGGIARVSLRPAVHAHPLAVKKLAAAEAIIFSAGDLYTSTIPVLLPGGMREAIARSKAQIIFVANLMTKRGQTDRFALSQLVGAVDEHLAPSTVDTVLVNSAPIPKRLLARYATQAEQPISLDTDHPRLKNKKIIATPLLDIGPARACVPGDRLRRSTIRHDPAKLARALKSILSNP